MMRGLACRHADIAVTAGARSALASLWFVNDAAATQLVSDFNTELTGRPENTKAQAPRTTQKKLLTHDRHAHQCYYSSSATGCNATPQ